MTTRQQWRDVCGESSARSIARGAIPSWPITARAVDELGAERAEEDWSLAHLTAFAERRFVTRFRFAKPWPEEVPTHPRLPASSHGTNVLRSRAMR